jgi:hypothetical protein
MLAVMAIGMVVRGAGAGSLPCLSCGSSLLCHGYRKEGMKKKEGEEGWD